MLMYSSEKMKVYTFIKKKKIACLLIALLFATFLSIHSYAQSNIIYAEWYIDYDPGFASGNSIPLVPSAHLQELPINIDPATLSSGVHQFTVRAKGANGNWSLNQRWLYFKSYNPSSTFAAPNITSAEWFLDTDPGLGNATSIPVTSSSDLNGVIVNIDPASLSSGVHQFTVRARDVNGNWSLNQRWMFFKSYNSSSASEMPNITSAEWFLDNDPGLGNATSIPVTSSSDLNGVIVNIDPASLSSGVHQFTVRARDANGNWSLNQRWLFFKSYNSSSASEVPNITSAEWFLDTDPGLGNATSIPVTSSSDLNGVIVNIDPASLSSGVHQFTVRARDVNGNWSLNQRWLFFKSYNSSSASEVPNITSAEWFLDNDPGLGNATSIPVTSSSDLNGVIVNIDPATLSSGVHQFTVRARDANGNWSLNQRWLFFKSYNSNNSQSVPNLTYLEYYIDQDPGIGKGISVTIPKITDIADLYIPVDINGLAVGDYTFYLRGKDENGTWSLVNRWAFKVDSAIDRAFAIGKIASNFCAGNSLSIPVKVNAAFGSGNVFTAQLSNSAGDFGNPTNIGTLTALSSDTIKATIPAYIPIGNNYRIRVIASTPRDTTDYNDTAITISRGPEQSFLITGKSSICVGSESYTLSNSETGVKYTWTLSGGGSLDTSGTPATVNWSTAGLHTLSVTPSNGCGNGQVRTLQVRVFGAGPSITPVITVNGRKLTATGASAAEVLGYQWYKDGAQIAGATDINFNAAIDGTYTVRFINPCGIGPESATVIIITRMEQTITFIPIPSKTFGDPHFVVSATASSGLPVTFNLVSGPAIIKGDTLLLTGAGTVTIDAIQAGNNIYETATVRQSFVVNKATQTITFEQISDKNYGSSPFELMASASTGLPVNFSVTSGHATISGNSVSLKGAGNVIVRASQAGNVNYSSAFADRIFCVTAVKPDTIKGFTETCLSSQRYSIDTIPGAVYTWSVSGGGILSSTVGSSIAISWNKTGTYSINVVASANCGNQASPVALIVKVADPLVPGAVSNLFPLNAAVVKSFPLALSWQPATNAQFYDVYVWQDELTEPLTPLKQNINEIGTVIRQDELPGFSAGKVYKWKVVAKNSCKQTANSIQSFSIYNLPNLIVEKVETPVSAFSGKSIDISWVVRNIGKESTGSTKWTDYAYLSQDTILHILSGDYLLGAKENISSLMPGESYSSGLRINIPDSTIGKWYILVVTNSYDKAPNTPTSSLTEESLSDNMSFKIFEINLTPPADLQVTSVIAPGDAFSGDSISINYTVKNKGKGITNVGNWKDYIYISPDPVFDINTVVKIGETLHTGVLSPDSSYTTKAAVGIPLRNYGTHFIYVLTDAQKQVYEFTFKNNNSGRSDTVNLILGPTPDFVVSDTNAPDSVSSDESLSISLSILNQGAKVNQSWADAIYLSKDPVFAKSKSTLLGSKTSDRLMKHGDIITNSININIPKGFQGKYYFYFVTDINDDIFEFNKEDNNVTRTDVSILAPDLVVSNVDAAKSAISGSNINVNWTIKNQGNGKVLDKNRTDAIFVSKFSTFEPSKVLKIDALVYNTAIAAGASLNKQKSVRLPDSLSGTYYLFVYADAHNDILEDDKENNNITVSDPLQISLAPPVDLEVTSIKIDADTIISETGIQLKYSIKNSGQGDIIGKTWKDKIYFSKYPDFNSNASLIKSTARTQALLAGASYEVEDSIYFSMRFMRDLGIENITCYFFIKTDADDNIYEHNGENNNLRRSAGIFTKHSEYTDLEVTETKVPDSLITGKTYSIEWKVTNLGGAPGYYYDYWYDGVFFSKDTIWDNRDTFVTDKVLYSPLPKNASYSANLTFKVPDGLSGEYFVFAVADYKNFNRDKNLKNNFRINRNSDGLPKPVYVTLTPSPDLVVSSFEVPGLGYSGQPVTIKWEVSNKGVGPTTKGEWTERIYLSRDQKLDASDISILTFSRKGNLKVDSSYIETKEVFIPITATGNYYVLFNTDDNNVIFEDDGENNNLSTALIYIIQPELTDLIVKDVSLPATAILGDSISVKWVIKNQSDKNMKGTMSEGIYLSKDTLWSIDDKLAADFRTNDKSLEAPEAALYLPPLAEKKQSFKLKINGITPGDYYALVRTDLKNNIPETDESNNVSSSLEKINISVAELPIGVVTASKLFNNEELYYRIEVPDSLEGETMIVSLKGIATGGVNELYIRYGEVPTRINYDFGFDKAVSADQDIVIPVLKKGTYYLMVYGYSSQLSKQDITLLAKKINFGIHSIASREGGNTGSVTVKITGAKFEAGMQVMLTDPSLGTITAHSVKYINSTSLFASFNLSGARTGLYDVKATKTTNQATILSKGYAVVQGSGGSLAGGGFYCSIQNVGVQNLLGLDIQHPSETRIRRVFPITINYGNSGNVDIPVPTRILISISGDPISFTSEGLIEQRKELYLELKELHGPQEVLRPGATGSITIYTQASTGNNLVFRLIE